MRVNSGALTLRLRQPPQMKTLMRFRYLWVSLRTTLLVLLYYSFSIGITFYQKWFIKDFHFPLIVVTCHLVVKFILSWLCRVIYTLITRRQRVLLPWNVYVRHLAVTGFASALDIGFSNWSFEFITISLYTMTKSTCIIFILAFSLSFGLEKRRPSLIAVVSLIAIGLFLFTYQSTQFNLEGFLLVLSASALAGLRWTLAQLVMQRKELGLGNPVDMMYHIQPWMILGLLPLAITFEGSRLATSEKIFRFTPEQEQVLLNNLLRILGGSVIAFFMEVSEYLLLSYTSSLTLSIAGILKEIFTLYLAVVYSGDLLSPLNMVGLVICLCGITIHVICKSIHAARSGAGVLELGGAASHLRISPAGKGKCADGKKKGVLQVDHRSILELTRYVSMDETVNESAENGRRDELRENLLVPDSDDDDAAVASTSTYNNANNCP